LPFGHATLGTTSIFRSRSLTLKAILRPISRTFLGSSVEKSRGLGPWALPPPRSIGLLRSPKRAFPVPFCGRSFLPEPWISPRCFVLAVPVRWESRYQVTQACRMSLRTGWLKTVGSNWTTWSFWKGPQKFDRGSHEGAFDSNVAVKMCLELFSALVVGGADLLQVWTAFQLYRLTANWWQAQRAWGRLSAVTWQVEHYLRQRLWSWLLLKTLVEVANGGLCRSNGHPMGQIISENRYNQCFK
jgi:hypothetical protein